MKSSQLGVDTGGTFTDIVWRDEHGVLRTHKLLSTPKDPSDAIVRGVEQRVPKTQHASLQVVHGTTVATNALLERAGARVALITNEGFEDVLVMRRQHRPHLYRFAQQLPKPVASRCFGIRGRINERGQIDVPLDTEALISIAQTIAADASIEAVAVVLLHAYANPTHEQQVVQAIRRANPALFVCASTSLSREYREYERASTTCANAYVGPVMFAYLTRLKAQLHVQQLDVFQSNGTRADADEVALYPVHTALSGPAGGVMGALTVAKQLGEPNIITFDMGGTSTDVSLCLGSEASHTDAAMIGGLHLQVPMLDIHTVGAGGGSLASLDYGAALRVGPESAGASPGPCAYGKGGTEPTVTDAHVVLGRLRPDQFLGATMSLDVEAAIASITTLAGQLSLSIEQTALGIIQVADAAMQRAIKVISVERGHDPRTCALVAFGGAGGLHACRLARSLNMRKVIMPEHPGLLSAFGMIHSPQAKFLSQTRIVPMHQLREDDVAKAQVLADFDALRQQVRDVLDVEDIHHRWLAALRYVGQSFTLELDITPAILTSTDGLASLEVAFTQKHQQEFGWVAEGRAIEWVTTKLQARVATVVDVPPKVQPKPSTAPKASTAQVYFDDGPHPCWVRQREHLPAKFDGPGIITEYSATTVVPPGWRGEVIHGHVVLMDTEAAQ